MSKPRCFVVGRSGPSGFWPLLALLSGACGGGGGGSSSGSEAPKSEPVLLVNASFDDRKPGEYQQAMVFDDFGGSPSWNNGLDPGRASIALDGDNPVLRVTFVGGEFGPKEGGVQFIVPLEAAFEELYLSYRLRFAAGFEFMRGGKLPGLVGGSSPTGCVADTDGFSARGMWRAQGAAVQYMYFPEKQNDCGDDYPYVASGQSVHFVPGTWHTVAHRVSLNTPGQQDGILQAWIDGELVVDERQFLYRLDGADFAVDALYFSTFFGGDDDTWAPPSDQVLDFDDFQIFDRVIEPLTQR